MSAGVKNQKARTAERPVWPELDAVLKKRFHGAVNIRGIRYQILYSILRALQLYDEGNQSTSIRLEGIEDVDLLGLYIEDKYIQVKSSRNPWNWARLKDPVKKFLEVYRANSDCSFVLVVNFQLCKDIAKLAKLDSLCPRERERIRDKFRKLCHEIGGTSDEADYIVNRLTIISLPEMEISEQLRPAVFDAFGLASEAVDVYVWVLIARFLDWAANRKTVTSANLDSVRADVGEALARESEFQAYGRGLVDRISWKLDANITDFFEGKGTRSGHIVAGVDVKRSLWIERIGKALNSSRVCIIRSSSGQGKSALLYRYAYEHWSKENTYVLRIAESSTHVGLICDYLRFRANLGLPIFLLIDNAGWRTRLWPLIAQECAALGIQVLITIRNEDWHRFARESLTNYEILEPVLDMDEAREIFRIFKARRQVHISVASADWAYERIGKPRLLMEYVYLLTHGRMLEDRLRDQMRQFLEQREDPAKVEILRRITLADALGAPVLADRLLKDMQLRDDPQQVLNSLSGEYINLEDGVITGFHWVRSDHLAHILHEGYPNPGNTALTVLNAIPPDRIPAFVSNALSWQGLSVDMFIKGLAQIAESVNLGIILAFLRGLFEAGEKQFFDANRSLFDESYDLSGPSGPFLLCADFLPTTELNIISEMNSTLGNEMGGNYRKMKEIASRVVERTRGRDLVREFLNEIIQYLTPEKLRDDLVRTGRLLDWCFSCSVSLPAWSAICGDFLTYADVFSLSLDKFCIVTQGLFRYDERTYRNWFSKERENIIGYLKLHTDCIELRISDEALYIEFFIDPKSKNTVHEQTMSRLRRLHLSVPFCERYQSQGLWLLPFDLTPPIDDETCKNIPKDRLLFETDVEKNVIWKNVTGSPYLPDSYYKYEELWHDFRKYSLLFVEGLSRNLQKVFTGRRFSIRSVFGEEQLLKRLEKSSKNIPTLSAEDLETIGKTLSLPLREILEKHSINKWLESLRNFFSHISQYAQNHNMKIGKLAVSNFLYAVDYLPEMHETFARLFENAPDYFNAGKMNGAEIKAFHELAGLLDVWILNPPKTPQRNILRYVKVKKERKRREIIQRVRRALAPLEKRGIATVLPLDVYVRHPLQYFPLAFSVNDPCYLEKELMEVIEAITGIKEIVHFFYLIPIHKGARFLKGGYLISSDKITELREGGLKHWETFTPYELSEDVFNCLPHLPFSPSEKWQIWTSIYALFAEVDSFIKRKNRVEELEHCKNRFDVELCCRQKAQLHELEGNLGAIVSQIVDHLRATFQSKENNSAFMVLESYLENIRIAFQNGNIDDSLIRGDFSPQAILDLVEQL